jgi:formyltetrahydrofolate-dependent phosphoribosylglycinamide formyltransferase
MNEEPLRLAVLLSGSGRTLDNLLRRITEGHVHARVVAVASNRAGVRGLEIADAAGIPTAVFRKSAHPDTTARDRAMWDFVHEHDAELVVLAGYLALLDLEPSRGVPVINIHPSLLPRHGGDGYYGDRVHASVLESGDPESGCTVHRVDPIFDHGPILAQQRVPVRAGDTVRSLADRVFEAECELYPRTIDRIARGELRLDEE